MMRMIYICDNCAKEIQRNHPDYRTWIHLKGHTGFGDISLTGVFCSTSCVKEHLDKLIYIK